MGELRPPEPPLATDRILLRPFHLDDAATVAAACQDPTIPRYTMMPDDLTEDSAREWITRGIEWWPRGVARFAITRPPEARCVGQIGVGFEPELKRAEAFYWLDSRVRGLGLASEALELVTRWGVRRARSRSSPSGYPRRQRGVAASRDPLRVHP